MPLINPAGFILNPKNKVWGKVMALNDNVQYFGSQSKMQRHEISFKFHAGFQEWLLLRQKFSNKIRDN